MTGTIKISNLPAAPVLDGTERVAVVDNGVTVQATTQQIANLATTGPASSVDWGTIVGTLSDQTDLSDALNAKAAIATAPLFAQRTISIASELAQLGVLLDTYWQAGDADDTASMTRAVAAGYPIILGPRTYTINNFSSATGSDTFTLIGTPGVSTIQRTSAVSSTFFSIRKTNVFVYGVTFDLNKSAVTANQWGVLLNQGSQVITFSNCVFKNNSGTLGTGLSILSTGPAAGGSYVVADCEVTGCTFNALYCGSACNGIISNCYVHDNSGLGITLQPFTAVSGTNYIRNVLVTGCRANNNTVGIQMGGYGSPYSLANIPAQYIMAHNNVCIDNSSYGIAAQGYDLTVDGNLVTQSADAVVVLGAINGYGARISVRNNNVRLVGRDFAIDVGGCVNTVVDSNTVTMTQGACLNVGATQGSRVTNNICNASGSATGIFVYATEGDGQGGIFPQTCQDLRVTGNTINMSGGSTAGVRVYDNAGGVMLGAGPFPTIVEGNNFDLSNSATVTNCIIWYGQGLGASFNGNIVRNGFQFVDPDGNGDVLFDTVYLGNIVQGLSSTTDIRSIVPRYISTYGGGGSILWVSPTSGGSGYTAATTLSASGSGGGSGWTGTATISGGVIIGVRTTAFGTGYSGTITISATDSGGGAGATFVAGNIPQLPAGATLTYISAATHALRSGGGFVGLNPASVAVMLQNGSSVKLRAIYTAAGNASFWRVESAYIASFASSGLPTPSSNNSGAIITVTGSGSGMWSARSNGTNWIYADGTTAP